MGRLKNGPFSGFTGRTGSLVGYRKKGKWIMAAVKATATKEPTVLQLNQRIKFGKMTSWLSWVAEFINIGFKGYDAEMSAMNAAVSYNLEHAITGIAPNFAIDYPEVVLSRGRLAGASFAAVGSGTGIAVEYTWVANIGSGSWKATDRATFVVYNPTKDEYVMLIGAAARSALTFEMQLPPEFSGDTIQCWMAFVSVDGKLVSTSNYVGALIIV